MAIRVLDSQPLSLGIDIGGTKAHGVVLDAGDRVLAEAELPTEPTEVGIRRTVLAVSDALAGELGVRPSRFTTVGLGIPGVVDPAAGVVETAVNLRIARTDLAALLADAFAAKVRVENDVKATALGAGLALGTARDLAYVNIGTGVAAAAVSRGRLIRGARNGAGEIGHFVVDPSGEACPCGQRGCLETVLGGGHLAKRLLSLGLGLDALGTDPAPAARAEKDRLVAALATALNLVAIVYDSAVIVIGGGVPQRAGWLRPAVVADLRRRAEESPFLAGLAVADRVVELPPQIPVAAIGAAVVGSRKRLRAGPSGPAVMGA